MTNDQNKYCKRCGNCCKGMIWKKRFSFRKVLEMTRGQQDKNSIEKTLRLYYKRYLHKIGLPIKKIYPLKWDKDNKIVIINAEVGKCKHLVFIKEKAVCLNYEDRPNECRNYLCKKARQQIMLEKAKQSERSAKLLKSHLLESSQKSAVF